jgi:methyl-accepting chemotaxis protein
MRRILKLSLAVKLLSASAVTLIAVVVIVGLAARLQYQAMLADRVDQLHSVMQVAGGIAKKLASEEQEGKLSHEAALERFRSLLRPVTFGQDGYVFAYSMDGVLIMQPQEPQNEGKNLLDRQGADGSRPIPSQIAVARLGGGTLTVLRPRVPGGPPLEKMNYVLPFTPWNMFIAGGLFIDDIDAAFRSTLWHLGFVAAVVILIGGTIALLIGRNVAGSVSRLKTAMERLARNELETAIPGLNRGDEIGAMAGAVSVFRDHMRAEARLTAEQETLRDRAIAERAAALVLMADTIETETNTAMGQVGEVSNAMTATAAQMHLSAARTGAAAQSAAETSAEALSNAQAVAAATEQLSTSIHQIGSQVAQSTAVVNRAVEAGKRTRETIERLTGQVARIGTVADVIGEIAARTNLLALNATIEAARAGDAGKGFAVVAGEVKQLAAQTARSTQEITQSIAEVSAATTASVEAVSLIEQTIAEVSAIAVSISAAVEQQGAATAEIARNVALTATAANEMAGRIAEVSVEADGTDRQAAEVESHTTTLAGAVGDLRRAVVRAVRTSTAEADRRSSARLAVDLACQVRDGGRGEQAARVIDLSDGGASIADGPAMTPGSSGSLVLERTGSAIPFTVRHVDNGVLHVAFRLDEAASGRLRALLSGIEVRRAA